MAKVEIRDHALWAKHIHGDEGLRRTIEGLAAGELVELTVDGFSGTWRKMDDGKDGRPTPGIRALLSAKKHWHGLQAHRGELVEISGQADA